MTNRKAFASGLLSGTHTFKNDLLEIENPDEIEKFLLEFCSFKLSKDLLVISSITSIASSEQFLKMIESIKESNAVGLYITSGFEKLYIATDNNENYIIDIIDTSPALIGKLTSIDTVSKYIINSFSLLKLLGERNLEARRLFDIPTYIKLLINNVDPYKKAEDYLKQYSDFVCYEDDEEKTHAILARFALNIGQYLAEKITAFEMENVATLINENAEFEAIKSPALNKEDNLSTINFKYVNIKNAMDSKTKQLIEEYKEKAYLISSLGRIIPKYSKKADDIVKEALFEDLTNKILSELYSNNIPVKYDLEQNEYVISCKQKNVGNIFNITQAIFIDSFDNIFGQSPEITVNCHIK